MLIAAALLQLPTHAHAVSPAQCGSLEASTGPFDYRTARYVTERGEYTRGLLRDVEINHFRPEIENLIRRGNAYFGDDLNYTLMVFPNHHRALVAMRRLGVLERTDKPKGAKYPVECYFERALRFAPDDHIARGLYANFLTDSGRREEAERHLDLAASEAAGNPLAQRNLGILYLVNGNLEKALAQAHLAEQLGADISALRKMLEEKGAWKPAAIAAPSAGTQPASSPSR
jgi:hypothetical protein